MYKVVIADDEMVEREALAGLIRGENGFEVREAADGQEVVDIADEFKPDIVLMDIKMPVMSGIEAAKRILADNRSCKIIMLTGFTYFNYAKESVSLGVFDFLVKPVDDDEVIKVIYKAQQAIDVMRVDERKRRIADEYLESQLLSDMIFGGMEDRQILQTVEELQISSRFYTAAIIYPDVEYGKVNSVQSLEAACRKALNALTDDGMKISVCSHYGRIYILLAADMAGTRTEYMHIFERIVRQITISQNCIVGMGVSNTTDQETDIPILFQNARKAYNKTNSIQFYSPRVYERTHMKKGYEIEQEVCELYEKRRFTELLSRIRVIMDECFQRYSEPVGIICELLIVLNWTAVKYIETEATYSLFSKLQSMQNNETIKQYAVHYVQRLIDGLIEHDTRENSRWTRSVENYIEENYKNNITLEEAAGQVGFSTYYFSRLFKNQYQVTFIDYLTEFRVNQAKKLMIKGKISVKDVCYQVGYSEPNYFARVFKKVTGMTPSDFQKQYSAR